MMLKLVSNLMINGLKDINVKEQHFTILGGFKKLSTLIKLDSLMNQKINN